MVLYADAPTATATTFVTAPPDQVWPLVTDLDLPARFSDEFQGADWIDGASGPAVGARFEGRNRNRFVGEWTVTCTVRECTPGHSFGWVVNDVDRPSASWRFDLEAEGEGTRLTQTAVMGPGRSGLSEYIESDPAQEEAIVAGRLESWETSMAATVDGIRRLAEGEDERA